MLLDQRLELVGVFFRDVSSHDAVGVQLAKLERVGDAAGHPCAGVPADRAQRDRNPACHVLAEVVACAFHDGDGSRVAHAEALSNPARDEELPAGRAVTDGVARKDRVVRAVVTEWFDRDHAAAHALAHVVLRLSFEAQLYAGIEKGAEALARAAPILAMVTLRQRRPDRPPRVVDLAARWRLPRRISIPAPGPAPGQGRVGWCEDKREVEPRVRNLCQQFDAPDYLLEAARAQACQVLADLTRDEEQVIDDVLRPSFEFGAKVFALRGDARRTGVQVALPRHVAAQGDQDAGAEAKLLSAKRRGDDDVAASAEAAIRAKGDALAQAVGDEDLLRFREAKLPRRARVLDRRQRRSACAAIVSRDEDVVGSSLRDARGDGADARLRHKLDPDPRLRVHGLEVVDELREIFDGVDVVVRRRGDELHARLCVA